MASAGAVTPSRIAVELESVVARASYQYVHAAPAFEHVVAATTDKHVIAIAADERLARLGARHNRRTHLQAKHVRGHRVRVVSGENHQAESAGDALAGRTSQGARGGVETEPSGQ